MMAILTIKQIDVQGDPCMIDEGLKELLHPFKIEIADSRSSQLHVKDEGGPVRTVQRDRCQRLVHRNRRRSVSSDPLSLSQGLPDSISQADPHIFHGVMGIDPEIALGLEGEVQPAVINEKAEHMIEEGNACTDGMLP